MEKVKKTDNPWYYYLNSQIVKKRKPCLTGDFIHLKSFSGCYKVYAVNTRTFTVMKNRKEVEFPWEQFRCLKGQGDSEEVLLKRELKSLIDTINISMSKQALVNEILSSELKNLRKTFV